MLLLSIAITSAGLGGSLAGDGAVALCASSSGQAATAEPRLPAPGRRRGPVIEDFTIVQISDTHVEPRLAGAPAPKTLRGEETFQWMHTELARPQTIGGVEVAPPAFVVVTGDVTEFGAPGETWSDVERLFGLLPCKWYVVPGNHDNTWHPIVQPMKAQNPQHTWYGSFDRFGVHFVLLNSATLQEPLPSFDAVQLEWLKKDVALAGVRPVFLFLHHPPDSTEFAQPYTRRMFLDALDGANVAAIFYGHGHAASHHVVDGIDCIQGGSTFAARGVDNRGYNVIAVKDGRLRVAYRWLEGQKPPTVLLDKALAGPDAPASRLLELRVAGFEESSTNTVEVYVEQAIFPEESAFQASTSVFLDDEPVNVEWFRWKTILARANFRPRLGGTVSALRADLRSAVPGFHLLTVETRGPGGEVSQQSSIVAAGLRKPNATPERSGETLWENDDDWADELVNRESGGGSELDPWGRPRVSRRVGLTAPSHAPKDYFFGVAARGAEPLRDAAPHGFRSPGGVYVDPTGDAEVRRINRLWPMRMFGAVAIPLRAASFATALAAEDRAYFGDVDGRLYAVDLIEESLAWCVPTGGFAIEAAPTIAGDLVVVGTWDGNVYALRKADGALVWKQPGPKASAGGGAARYYAPADVSPVVAGESIFVCDRGYALARYSFTGAMTKLAYTNIAAIGGSEDGKHVNLRCLDHRLVRIDAQGQEIWSAAVQLGRLPVAPTELDGKIHVASDTGLVTTLDAATGRVLDTYQATPGAYVMSAVQVDRAGNLHVAGTDGFETIFPLPK